MIKRIWKGFIFISGILTISSVFSASIYKIRKGELELGIVLFSFFITLSKLFEKETSEQLETIIDLLQKGLNNKSNQRNESNPSNDNINIRLKLLAQRFLAQRLINKH